MDTIMITPSGAWLIGCYSSAAIESKLKQLANLDDSTQITKVQNALNWLEKPQTKDQGGFDRRILSWRSLQITYE
jgi:hypothetical protein